jgi:hypothetical protein
MTRLLEVGAHEHLATREYYEHTAGIGVRGNLLVKYTQKVAQGHILERSVGAAVATAVPTPKITTKRTLPKECTQRVTFYDTLLHILK